MCMNCMVHLHAVFSINILEKFLELCNNLKNHLLFFGLLYYKNIV